MVPDQGHEQDNRSGRNIGSKSCQRCVGCDAHYYWCHFDDTQKYFFKCMVGDFQEKMIIPEKFVENFKGQISEVIKLEGPDGNKYDVQATRNLNKIVLGSGWTTFATFYELKEGCVLVFRYSGDSHFRVLIFDYPSCCEKEVFNVVMNCGPNAQEKDTRLNQSLVRETLCRNGGSGNGETRQRCGHCDVHFYWHHLDDRKKHFMKLMIGDFQRQTSVPEKFVKNFRGRISTVIKLQAPDGNLYNIQVSKDLNKTILGSGWEAFVNANGLKECDLLVFRYNGDSDFKVLIFEPSGCEKQSFHIVMNHAPNVQDMGIGQHQSFPGETRRGDVRSRDSNSRKTKKTTLLDSPSLRSAEGVTSQTMNSGGRQETTEPRYALGLGCNRDGGLRDSDSKRTRKMTPLDFPSARSAEGVASETMNSGGLRETTELCYVLATWCNLSTAQKAEVDTLVKKIRPLIPLYITDINKTSLLGSLVFCKDYAAKHLPHEDKFITLCHPQKSNIWVDNLKVNTDGACMLSVGWSCFVRHNKLRVGDICAFEVSKSNGEVTMVVHTLERGHRLPGKEPESQNKCGYPVQGEETKEEESYKPNAESNYYYSLSAKFLTSKEKKELFESISIQPGNPVYVTILQKYHLSRKTALLAIPKMFRTKYLVERSHDILLVRPNREVKWIVKYYHASSSGGFGCRRLAKFASDNNLCEGDVCVFELIKAVSKATMMVHVFRKVDGRLALLD